MDEDFINFSSVSTSFEDGESFTKVIKRKNQEQVSMINVKAPWLLATTNIDLTSPPLIRFHNEVLSFTHFISPTKKEIIVRDNVLKELTIIVLKLWPMANIYVFGSQLSNTMTPYSDLDFGISNVPTDKNDDPLEALFALSDAIRSLSIASYVEVISNAKVPILKFDHISSKLSVDIIINNNSGLDSGKLMKSYIKKYPPIKHLILVLKTYLNQRKLADTYTGGMGSFVLCSLIISFVQMRQRLAELQKIDITWNLGSVLLDFFSLYGSSFNFVHAGITIIEDGSYFNKKIKGGGNLGWSNPNRPQLLSIENPELINVDMGRNSFLMPKIRRSFEHTYQLLTTALSTNSIKNKNKVDIDSFLSYVIRADEKILQTRLRDNFDIKNYNHINNSKNMKYKIVYARGISVRKSPSKNSDNTDIVIKCNSIFEAILTLEVDSIKYAKVNDGWIPERIGDIIIFELVQVDENDKEQYNGITQVKDNTTSNKIEKQLELDNNSNNINIANNYDSNSSKKNKKKKKKRNSKSSSKKSNKKNKVDLESGEEISKSPSESSDCDFYASFESSDCDY